jgi:hypothetical protein
MFIQLSHTWHYQIAPKHYEKPLEAAAVNKNIIILPAQFWEK